MASGLTVCNRALRELGEKIATVFAASEFGAVPVSHGISEVDLDSLPPEQYPRIDLYQTAFELEDTSSSAVPRQLTVVAALRFARSRPGGAWADKARDNDLASLLEAAAIAWIESTAIDADLASSPKTETFNTDTLLGASLTLELRTQEPR